MSGARAIPEDFAEMSARLPIKKLRAHYRASEATIMRWRGAMGLAGRAAGYTLTVPKLAGAQAADETIDRRAKMRSGSQNLLKAICVQHPYIFARPSRVVAA